MEDQLRTASERTIPGSEHRGCLRHTSGKRVFLRQHDSERLEFSGAVFHSHVGIVGRRAVGRSDTARSFRQPIFTRSWSDPGARPCSDSHPHAKAHAHPHSDPHSYAHPHSYSHPHSYAHPHSYSHPHSYADPHSNSDSHPYTDPHSYAASRAHSCSASRATKLGRREHHQPDVRVHEYQRGYNLRLGK